MQNDLESATVEWQCDDQNNDNAAVPVGCIVLPEDVERVIEYQTSLRIKRNQDRLRKALLDCDGKCVISGETTPAALEVDHIRAVAANGDDEISNAVLMRADLHALFDRGVFSIAEDGEIQIDDEQSLSNSYRELLHHAKVDAVILDRIRSNLARRRAQGAA